MAELTFPLKNLIDLAPFYLWAYNDRVEIVNFSSQGFNQIGASGDCPHCLRKSYFRPLGAAHQEQAYNSQSFRIVNAAQCEACKRFLLVEGIKPFSNQPAQLVNVFPLGKPNETVDTEVRRR